MTLTKIDLHYIELRWSHDERVLQSFIHPKPWTPTARRHDDIGPGPVKL